MLKLSSLTARILTTQRLRDLEKTFKDQPLMERAGKAVAATILEKFPATTHPNLLFCVGPGHNGGDGLVAAQHLLNQGYRIVICCLAESSNWGAGQAAYQNLKQAQTQVTGKVTCTSLLPPLQNYQLVIDAIFGIGLKHSLTATPNTKLSDTNYAAWIRTINATDCPVLAVDIPSGLDADTGNVHGIAIHADHTCTFIAQKPGLWTADGPDYTGTISLHPLDLDWPTHATDGQLISWPPPCPALKRACNSHKGTYGNVHILGGATGMVGAPLLAGKAALFLGAGKVSIGFLDAHHPSVDCTCPELMLTATQDQLASLHSSTRVSPTVPRQTILAIGPGLGQSTVAKKTLLSTFNFPYPMVLDADALNLLAQDAEIQTAYPKRALTAAENTPSIVLTPHPSEAARLLGISTDHVQKNRLDAAQKLAQHFQAIVVLKGVGSIIAAPKGIWAINSTGNPGLATAGSGDVLTGMVSALLAQGYPPFAAASMAVSLHGAAAEHLAQQQIGPAGITASELIVSARQLFSQLQAT